MLLLGNLAWKPGSNKFDERAQLVVITFAYTRRIPTTKNVTMRKFEVKVRGADGKNGNLVRRARTHGSTCSSLAEMVL